LNDLLGGAWEQYKKALATGEILELEAKYVTFVAEVLDDVIDARVDEAA
jgi:hypothetical protein